MPLLNGALSLQVWNTLFQHWRCSIALISTHDMMSNQGQSDIPFAGLCNIPKVVQHVRLPALSTFHHVPTMSA